MNRCPISYETCTEKYSPAGLKQISPKLSFLQDFPLSKEEQLEFAFQCADKLSFSGVQKKLGARLSLSEQRFVPVSKASHFILKPQSAEYPELPQNEDLTMKLAKLFGIETPMHGLIYCKDGSLSYFIKRFDRKGRNKKIAIEDFAQLAEVAPDTKYDFSMERIIPLIEKHCTFPSEEKRKFFALTLFCFLVGNEDLHLKNLSLIRRGALTQISPAYDLINSCLVLASSEDMALPLHGKKSRLTKGDLLDYFGKERLGLTEQSIKNTLSRVDLPSWESLIEKSFLSAEKKQAYRELLKSRYRRLFH